MITELIFRVLALVSTKGESLTLKKSPSKSSHGGKSTLGQELTYLNLGAQYPSLIAGKMALGPCLCDSDHTKKLTGASN